MLKSQNNFSKIRHKNHYKFVKIMNDKKLIKEKNCFLIQIEFLV